MKPDESTVEIDSGQCPFVYSDDLNNLAYNVFINLLVLYNVVRITGTPPNLPVRL